MICDYCAFKSECDYYENTIKPIENAFCIPSDTFEFRIREALDDFDCEYFKEGVTNG